MRRSRVVAGVPRGVRVPEEGTSLLHSLHCRIVQLHRLTGPADPPVPGLHGSYRPHHSHLGVRTTPLHTGEGGQRIAHISPSSSVKNVISCIRQVFPSRVGPNVLQLPDGNS